MLRKLLFLSVFIVSVTLASCSSSSSDGSDITTDDPQTAFNIAKSKFDKKDYLEAIDDFTLIKSRFSGSAIADDAQYFLAMSYYNRTEYVLAAYEFEFLIKNYPSSQYTPDSYYQVAMCYYRLSPDYTLDQTYTNYAVNQFLTFIGLFPQSKLVTDAELKVKELRNKLARKTYENGRQYVTLESNKAAIIYFDNVIDMYFDTDWADDAMLAKIQALINRRRNDEAKTEISRFESKFPSSPLISQVRSLKSRI